MGAVILAVAKGWAVFTHFNKKNEKGLSALNVTAVHGSVAAGRDITRDHRPRQIAGAAKDELERLAAQVAREKGVEVAPLRAILVKLGERGVVEEDIPKRLDTAADELIKLRTENEQLRRGPPALAAIAERCRHSSTRASSTMRVAHWRMAARQHEPCGSTRAVSRRHSWLRRRGSTICSSPIAQPHQSMPKRPHLSRLAHACMSVLLRHRPCGRLARRRCRRYARGIARPLPKGFRSQDATGTGTTAAKIGIVIEVGRMKAVVRRRLSPEILKRVGGDTI
jgi:hypothetical protein